ncbi:MAG: PaaI family thioesterase [Rhodoferax sp.]
MDAQQLQSTFPEHFAPWVLALGLTVEEVKTGSVVLRLPHSAQLSRSGGTLCGQAMMAAADTAMVVALIRHFGAFRPCTTVQMGSSFLKPLSNQDALVEATVIRAGKSMAFGEIDIRGADDGKSVCRSSVAYALL